MNILAIDGGLPVRTNLLPYGRQTIDTEDIEAVVQVLQSDWLTTGPTVIEFETALTNVTQVDYAVAVSSGTAALHTVMYAIDIQPGDEVIIPPITFAATANSVVFQGGVPIFVDVSADTLLIDPAQIEAKITSRTKAIIAVDYAGQPCDYNALRAIADKYNLILVADACHAIGGSYQGKAVGNLADLSIFSFHPVKHIAMGEGGAITTNNSEWFERMSMFRNHGITTDHRQRAEQGSWFYEMVDLGYNYRLTDIQCALGINQLQKLSASIKRRQEIAHQYDNAFTEVASVSPLAVKPGVLHAYHLYVVQLELDQLTVDRNQIFSALRAEGIGVNLHYIPVHLHPYYQNNFGTNSGLCKVAEAAYNRIITLPMFPAMTDDDVQDVILSVKKVIKAYTK